ncbi:MAG: hypothetical protein HY420_03185 [Candidatus Kerfeldbacteria bacterium]|nr:hypothetical protein [Candidatus Kerfeldbacteria bacterium]
MGKGILAALVFVAALVSLSFSAQREDEHRLRRGVWMLFWTGLAGTLVTYGFFLYETFLKG